MPFEQHLDGFEPQLKRMALRRACWYADADDLAQDARCRLWQYRAGYRPDRPFANWAARVCRNAMLDYLVAAQKEVARSAYSVDQNPAGSNALPAPCPIAPLLDADWLRERLAFVRPDRLTLVRLAVQGHERKEIGQRLGITSENVRARLYRLRKEMQASSQQAGF